ncbi:Ribosomal large subunit pseudouridine synthase F [Arcticibacter svalbardensis MN12-7]|uniref:Pseudouridine synthase n=1 Tax=Arcticibacter svalbardensis MN12-7 TaxID=1150600 RepID=R9GN15_9SPHI|nr:23S rRNA pseudouridine(2604) synthase RluF [Arcticibacter svalbardensis]EOR92935.1 Ribosomal large subunit pseudouridine synthase F [Arcticibacter svalbardensis MN12-7]
MSDSSTRLNKYISESGLCSRRAADKHIENGTVFINGKKAKVGDQVRIGDRVIVNGQLIEPKEEESSILLAFNKPVGITSTTETTDKTNIVDYVNHSDRIFPIGRLDKDSQGLILLTNNGDLVNKILRAGNNHEKEYLVTVNKPITDAFITGMAGGVPVMDVMTKKCKVDKESPFIFKITLIQGLNRQIRRMCEHFGYEVTKLERTRIMNITLKGLPLGDWRELTELEQKEIAKLIGKSSSERVTGGSASAGSAAKGSTGSSKRSSKSSAKGIAERFAEYDNVGELKKEKAAERKAAGSNRPNSSARSGKPSASGSSGKAGGYKSAASGKGGNKNTSSSGRPSSGKSGGGKGAKSSSGRAKSNRGSR